MPDPDTPSIEIVQWVRTALAHLYDHAYLQNHPLALILDKDGGFADTPRAQRVRRLLLDCIQSLEPRGPKDAPVEAVRAYAILVDHYVDGRTIADIAETLDLSERQVYREHQKGVEAIASLVWERLPGRNNVRKSYPPNPQDVFADRLTIVQGEVDRLRQSLQPALLCLQEVLEGVLEPITPRAQHMGIQVRLLLGDPCPPIVADRALLRQAFLNLLSYALDTFVIGDVVITISHDKTGFAIDFREISGASRTQHDSPVGSERADVRFALAQALIQAQGGRLETKDCEGRWKARIAFPGKATILVIDDNPSIFALFQRYLGGHNVSVVGAANSEQALRLVNDIQPQVITLDVMMPDQDGWEILKDLREAPSAQGIPIIICSVLYEPQMALSMGASDYVTKPISQAELLKTLRRWLGPLQPAA